MCEQTEINYLDGDVVWVKIGGCWWPGEVVGPEKLPPDVLPSFRKPPIAVVKFYQEDTYEYVKNLKGIYNYNCSRKSEFINKGLYLYRTKHGQMDKFPQDVIRAEAAVGGDKEILSRDEFQEVKKESYAGLFGDPAKKTPASIKKGRSGMDRLSISSSENDPTKKLQEKSNYKVHILVQGSKTQPEVTETVPSPSTSCAGSEPQDTPSDKEERVQSVSTFSTPTMSSLGIYACHACQFTTTRLNVLIMHNKTHSATFMPYTPSPIMKKTISKTPKSTKTPKTRKPKLEKIVKPIKKKLGQKRAAEEISVEEIKRNKTDEEIKSSLLADWDDIDEESINESTTNVMVRSPEIPMAAESPAVPTPAELPCTEVPQVLTPTFEKKLEESPVLENPESINDAKYEFCEDEDWPVETDIGRKIPRVKNPSKRRDETKSIDEDEMAREVAELLNKTTLPELPSAPEPLKVEENFPEPSIVKSPEKSQDKSLIQNTSSDNNNSTDVQPPKTIFKTKTFFRSRHSRSQDAIGKYVAEQLNAAERMDIADSELNGSEVCSPEPPRISPPIEHVKVARLAPKIQLKMMKAEAAQLLEQEKRNSKKSNDDDRSTYLTTPNTEQATTGFTDLILEKENVISIRNINDVQSAVVVNKDNQNHSSVMEQDNTEIVRQIETVDNTEIDRQIEAVDNTENDRQIEAVDNTENDRQIEAVDNTENDRQIEAVPLDATKIDYVANNQDLIKGAETYEPLMNESTASAVDALLSVSRETDRVTKVVSDDPPEDLFEDDNKDNKVSNTVNGFSIEPYEDKAQNYRTVRENSKEPSEDVTLENNQDPMENIQENYINIMPIVEKSKTQENLQLIADVATVKNDAIENENVEITPALKLNSNECLISESIPTESVFQVAEALINLPTTSILNKTLVEPLDDSTITGKKYPILNKTLGENGQYADPKNVNRIFLSTQTEVLVPTKAESLTRFETEEEKCENLNAAQSLVEMSESVDLKMNVGEVELMNEEEKLDTTKTKAEDSEITSTSSQVGQNVILTKSELNVSVGAPAKGFSFQSNPSKLLKILEEPFLPKSNTKQPLTAKQVIAPGTEKILNFDVDQCSSKINPANQQIIIRRTTPTKNILNSFNEITSSDKIILSPTNKSKLDVSSVQTYTIQTKPKINTAKGNTIIIQPKIRKIKPVAKLQKNKPETSLLTSFLEANKTRDKSTTENIFDINSMPVVLSDDILTPENIEKMPIVMSDGNIITGNSNPPKLLKTKQSVLNKGKSSIAAVSNKTELKTLLVNPNNEGNQVTTPNILSRSSKLRSTKPVLVFDDSKCKQKFIISKTEQAVKEIKQSPSILQPAPQTSKSEQFLILPSSHSPRAGRTQKIVINPQTCKAHVLVGKSPEATLNAKDNKPVSAKLIPSTSDTCTPGNTVMIITNAQGGQSRIVLTPEHERILFPNKQQQNITQLKQINYRPPNNGATSRTTISAVAPLKTQTRIVQKQKNTIITSKGQLIVGGRITATGQNVVSLPELRPAPKRIISAEPKSIVQVIPKTSNEQVLYLQQKGRAVMQITMADFEHLKRTGQVVQRPSPPAQDGIVIQNSITIAPTTILPTVQKQRVRKHATESYTPLKKVKHEIAIAPAATIQIPTLTPLKNTQPFVPSVPNTTTISTRNYSDLDNFEELLPSTAIARLPEPVLQPEPTALPPLPIPPPDQLFALPAENFEGTPGAYFLCVKDIRGVFVPVDRRPLSLENNQLVPMTEHLPLLSPQPERIDILEAALANSDVFRAETTRDDAPDFRDLNANVSVHCRVSETSTTLNQPIMTPIEMPSKVDSEPTTVPSNIEDGLAVIGLTPHTIPTSLELPITVTDPRIAPITTNPMRNNNYGPPLLPSPNTDLTFVTRDDSSVSMIGGPISMPLLTEDDSVGKSMPILTDDLADRTVSLAETSIESPSSIDVRESEFVDGITDHWPRRYLTPSSDTSETSAEIPLQPAIHVSANDLTQSI